MHPVDRPTPRTLQDAFGDGSTLSPAASEHPLPPILPFLLVCALAVLIALVTGPTDTSASESAGSGAQPDERSLRQHEAAAQLCGKSHTAVWADAQTLQCYRNQKEQP